MANADPGVTYPRQIEERGLPPSWQVWEYQYASGKAQGKVYKRYTNGKHKHICSAREVIKIHCKETSQNEAAMYEQYVRLQKEQRQEIFRAVRSRRSLGAAPQEDGMAEIAEVFKSIGLEELLQNPANLKEMLESSVKLKAVLEDYGLQHAAEDPSVLEDTLQIPNMMKTAFQEANLENTLESATTFEPWVHNYIETREALRNVGLEDLMNSASAMKGFVVEYQRNIDEFKPTERETSWRCAKRARR